MSKFFDDTMQGLLEAISQNEKELNKHLFDEFITSQSIEPINAQQVINAVNEMQEYCDKMSNVILCSPKMKLTILEQHISIPYTHFIADHNVPEGVAYVVTDEWLKKQLINALREQDRINL